MRVRIIIFAALNLDFSEWGEAFPNKLLGAATLDRLRHNAYRLMLDGDSYRAPRPLPEGMINSTKKQLKKEVK
jgi:DNA replication protein DnaC